jgi:tRNA(fMet)-specific endonuclease VapC
MRFLLDTCVLSDFIKGEINTLSHLKNILPTEINISTITIMEIQYGLALNPKLAVKIKPIFSELFTAINIIEFNQDDATQAALLRALLKQQGMPIGSYDILLAGTALNRKLTLVTSNTKEFSRINGLALEDWRQ